MKINSPITVLLFCENCIVSQQGTVSLINVFHELIVKKVPFKEKFWIYTYLKGVQGQHELSFTYIDPLKEEREISNITVNIDSNEHPFQWADTFNNKISLYGEYKFCVYIDNQLLSKNNLTVVPQKENNEE